MSEWMDRYTAHLTVSEIAALKAVERRRAATVPTPLAAFGLVDLGGVMATLVVGRYHLALYALPGFALALWVSARAFARRARVEGVQIAIRPWLLTTATVCLAGVAASRTGALLEVDAVSTVGPFLAQAIGLWLLARWADSDALLTASVAMVIASGLTAVLATADAAVAVQFGVYGFALLATAGFVRMRGSTT